MRYDRHFSPFSFACYSNSTECFKVLYNHGQSFSKSQDSLVKQWFSKNEDQVECLFSAVRHNNLQLFKILVNDLKLNAKVKDKDGQTVLHEAAA